MKNQLLKIMNTMNRFIFGIVFCFCFLSITRAQQPFGWESTNGPSTDAPTVLEVNTNGDILAGRGNILMRSTDEGESWMRLPFPRTLGGIDPLVTLPGAKIVILLDNGTLVRMNADGSSMTTLSSISGVGWLASDRMGDLFAYLDPSMVAKSEDAGDKWDTIFGPSGESILDISADEQEYYLGTGTGLYTSSNEGATWRICLNGPVVAQYYKILAGHNGEVWADCYDDNPNTNSDQYDFFYSTDYGGNWVYAGLGEVHYAYTLAANAQNELLMEQAGPSAELFKDSTFKNVSFNGESGVFALDSSGRWWAASNGIPNLYQTTGDPSWKWAPMPIPLSSSSYLFGFYSTIVAGSGSDSYFLDSLKEWKLLSGTNLTPLGVDLFDNSLLGTSDGTDLQRSTDSGRTWKSILAPAIPSGTVRVAAAAPSRIYVATQGVFYTANIGVDWSETNDNVLTGAVTALCADSNGRLYAACSDTLFTSSDEGNTWQGISLPVKIAAISTIRANRSGTVILCGSSDVVLRSEDQGADWQSAILPDSSTMTDILVASSSDVFASSKSGVFYWPAGSTRFYDASDNLDSLGVSTVAADDSGNIYAATDGLGVWKGVGELAILGVKEIDPITSNAIASPNPATSSVRIALPTPGTWNVEALDALGRTRPLTYSLTGQTLECDINNFPPGAYELVLHSGSTQIISRVQVIR